MPLLQRLTPVLVALVLASCGSNDKGGLPKGTPSVSDLLMRSVIAARAAKSFHFVLSHSNGSLPMPLNIRLVSADGDYVAPDRIKAAVKARAGSTNVSVDLIGIGDRTWVTNPFTRRWTPLPGTTARDIADPPVIISSLLGGLHDAVISGQEDVDGLKTYHVTGNMDSGALVDAFGDAATPGHQIAVDLWIGVSDHLLRRGRIAGRLSDDDADNVVRQVDLSRFDAPVDISAP